MWRTAACHFHGLPYFTFTIMLWGKFQISFIFHISKLNIIFISGNWANKMCLTAWGSNMKMLCNTLTSKVYLFTKIIGMLSVEDASSLLRTKLGKIHLRESQLTFCYDIIKSNKHCWIPTCMLNMILDDIIGHTKKKNKIFWVPQ